MHIVLLEPYYGGSHRYFIDQFMTHLSDQVSQITLLKLPPRHWAWRLQGSHHYFAQELNKIPPQEKLMILSNSLINLLALKGLVKVKVEKWITYFHENQIEYPVNPDSPLSLTQKKLREHHYPLIHLEQILASDLCLFNSQYNLNSTLEGIQNFLKKCPDARPIENTQPLEDKCHVLPIGVEALSSNIPWEKREKNIVWNHRNDFDKNPHEFCELAGHIMRQDPEVNLEILGENTMSSPFLELKNEFQSRVQSYQKKLERSEYLYKLSQCRVTLVTSLHDFYGLSVREAILMGVVPILPHRLVYPEMIPLKLHSKLLYTNSCEALEKTKALLDKGLTTDEYESLRKVVSDHSWVKFKTNFKHYLESIV